MKNCVDVMKVILSGEISKPMYEIPKTIFDLPRMTTLGAMYYISLTMVIDGKY